MVYPGPLQELYRVLGIIMKPVQRKIVISPISKESVIAQFKIQLPLPAYCSINWDSFEECLLDFLDDHEEGIQVCHEGDIKLSKEDRDLYIGILRDAMKSHNVIIASQ